MKPPPKPPPEPALETVGPATHPPPQKAKPGFFKVEPDNLYPGGPLGFALYVATTEARRVMVLDANDRLTPEEKDKVQGAGREVFVLDKDRDNYFRHLEDHLSETIAAESADSPRVAKLAYDLSLNAMEKVFDRPEAHVLARAQRVIETTADLVQASGRAVYNLLQIAEHDFYTYTHSCNVGLFSLGLVRILAEEGESHDFKAWAPASFSTTWARSTSAGRSSTNPAPWMRASGRRCAATPTRATASSRRPAS